MFLYVTSSRLLSRPVPDNPARHAPLAALSPPSAPGRASRQYREEAGLKQSDVARTLGRHQPFVSNLESGQRKIDLIELIDLADAIGFDLHDLIEELKRAPKH